MRVLHLHDAPHIHGGATAYLGKLLPEMAARGLEQAVFSLDRPADDRLGVPAGHFAYRWPAAALRRRRDFHGHHEPLAAALRDFVAETGPDLIHVQNMAAFRRTVFRTLAELPQPVLMTVHDFSLGDPNPHGLDRSGWTGRLKARLDRHDLARAQQAVFRAVDRFLCPTEALRQGLPFPSGRALLQRLPVAPAEAAPLAEDDLRLFFAGTLYRSKGVDVLLRALAAATGPASYARLRIAGTGDQEEALRRLAGELGLEEQVDWLGFLDPAGMEGSYQWANLQVLPSRVPENSPLTVLEAGARGRASIASHAGGVPELVAPPERGWTFPSEDHAALAARLEEASARPAERAARGEAARAWVRSACDPKRHWDDVERHYRELAGEAA